MSALPPPPAQPVAPVVETASPTAGIIGGALSGFSSVTGVLFFILGSLPAIIFNYGAAKINWSVNQSYFWAVIAFLFSGFYYPYYAFFQLKTLGAVSSTIQAVGARRRR